MTLFSAAGCWCSRLLSALGLVTVLAACGEAGEAPAAGAGGNTPPGAPPPAAQAPIPQEVPGWDHVVPAWYLGLPVMMRSFEMAPGLGYMTEEAIPPQDAMPFQQVVIYITGIADEAIGVSPAQTIRLPDGNTVSMPGHQAVLPCLNNPEEPALGVGYSVLPGPAATEHNLRADPEPPRSIIGGPLVNAIRIGPSWIPLTNHRAIEYGLHKGILRLRFFGANPTHWATLEWDDNYPYIPELEERCDEPARAPREHMLPHDPELEIPMH